MAKKVVAIVGPYRQGGATAQAVEAILAAAREQGAETKTIRLIDEPIEFCTNCRSCTQQPGLERGRCIHNDALETILAEAESADALVLASPVNYWNITAVSRRFLERLLGSAYWPWGGYSPAMRCKKPTRKAVLVSSCAMPLGWMIPALTGAPKALRIMAQSLGARPAARMWIGMTAEKQHPALASRHLKRAAKLGRSLVS